ncbi:unnamed protein product [Zymoseptoria tritici ST99CH_3D7]|uniref:Uncharacterized protein n=1 Tax=Zymoseptoria tritici (strain ST99CH_3D7) TaxID=1276538 RepID=A0A1X7RHL9_ZYMT9|nr:unnamed protein product [Zymoseptoria tritici ST99CH_3D7]
MPHGIHNELTSASTLWFHRRNCVENARAVDASAGCRKRVRNFKFCICNDLAPKHNATDSTNLLGASV